MATQPRLRVKLSQLVMKEVDLSHGAVIVSPFQNPFLNLTLEEALFRSIPFRQRKASATEAPHASGPLLFMYVNTPTVVLGSNQIPWREVNVPLMQRDGVPLTRRQSGGGSVFHDTGNLSLSFMTHRKDYAPRVNTEWLTTALRRLGGDHDMSLTSTYRQDLFLNQRKISGSAMRLIRDNAFHHCTLLVNSDLSDLKKYLKPVASNETFTNASGVNSVVSNVTKLCDELPSLRSMNREVAVAKVIDHLGAVFAERDQAMHFLTLDPEEDLGPVTFKTIDQNRDWNFANELALAQDWERVFAAGTSFSQRVQVPWLPPTAVTSGGAGADQLQCCTFDVSIAKGRVVDVSVGDASALTRDEAALANTVCVAVRGCRVRRADLQSMEPTFVAGAENSMMDVTASREELSLWWNSVVDQLCLAAGWGE